MPQPADDTPGPNPNRPAGAKPRRTLPPAKKGMSVVVKVILAAVAASATMFTCCAGWFGYNIYQGVQQAQRNAADPNYVPPPPAADGSDGFRAANSQIATKSSTPARGNSPAAVQLAAKFSESIKDLRQEYFTQRKKKPLVSLTDGEFLTYCHLDDKACVFLVHVPDLRKFTDDAREQLSELAWATAQLVVQSQVESPPPRLALGLRGVLLYDRVLIGRLVDPTDNLTEFTGADRRESGSGCERLLYEFFKPGEVSVPDASELLSTEPPATESSPEATPEGTTPPEDPAIPSEPSGNS